MTRLVFAVASHLHMTAGAVMASMGAHELFCWHYLLTQDTRAAPRGAQLSVEDEINAWQ
ncbi:hypothetical protein OKW45_001951 [Paraburkholderia sp. WSM4175]|uniref:hypothetical protein n=1 Tax=Paraburkholderia sp. WSM4175 TaxID=2991072 RepID=UPI003D1FEC93